MKIENSVQGVLAAMGSFILVTVVLAGAVMACKRRKRRRRSMKMSSEKREVEESRSFDPTVKDSEISMEKIRRATNNFSPELIVGDGSFGMVYKAELEGGRRVAVKKLDPDAFQGMREFRAEIETVGSLSHPNLAKIVGFCGRGAERILVYEFIERGNLDYWVHVEEANPLPWPTRLQVLRGVAHGLAYLHSLPNQIIHRDIKATNVLLDAHFLPRISDFGLARWVDSSRSHVSTQVAGTMGYMPPEYKEGYTVATVHADVFSFGVLMLEVALARRPNLPVHDTSLLQWARLMGDQNRHLDMLDPRLPLPHRPSPHQAERFFHLAFLCASDHMRTRPPMSHVLHFLSDSLFD